jgi:O-antigen/teichoic acid export membrane protein
MTEVSEFSNDARHTIRTVSLGTLLRLLRWPFVLLSVVFIPRVMQSETYGRYALFISVYFMADLLTDIGFLQVFGRFAPGAATPDMENRRAFLLQGFLATGVFLAGLACIPIVAFATLFSSESFPSAWLLPFCLLLVATRIEGVLFSFLYGLNHIARYSTREMLRSMLLFAGVLFFYIHYGLSGALWGLVVKESILCLVAARWTRHYLFRRCSLSLKALKPYARFGFAFYVPFLLFGYLQRSGAIFIQALTQSPEQVGYFDVANQFFLMIVSFLGVILVTLLPSMAAYREADDNEIIHRWHGNIMNYCGMAVFLLFNALVWFGEPVLTLCLGSDFVPVRNLALIMVLALAPGLMVYVGMNYAILDKDPRVYIFGVLAGIAAMALTCLTLIPFWGAAGAAWASVAGHAVLAVFFCCRYRAHFRTVLRGYVKALLVGLCFLPVLWIKVGLPWSAIGFVAQRVCTLRSLWPWALRIWTCCASMR